MIALQLCAMDKKKFDINVEENSTIGEIKEYISKKIFNCDLNKIKICFRKNILRDIDRLNSLNIQDDEKIILVLNKSNSNSIQNTNSNSKSKSIPISEPIPFYISSCIDNHNTFHKKSIVENEYYKEKAQIIQNFEIRRGMNQIKYSSPNSHEYLKTPIFSQVAIRA